MKKDYEDFAELFQKLFSRWQDLEKIPRNFGIEEKLYPSEVHTLDRIGRFEEINGMELAEKTGVSKSAVSQMAKKLEKKGLISRTKKNGNDKESYFRLTPKGKTVFEHHLAFDKELANKIAGSLEALSEEELSKTFNVFSEILDHFNRLKART